MPKRIHSPVAALWHPDVCSVRVFSFGFDVWVWLPQNQSAGPVGRVVPGRLWIRKMDNLMPHVGHSSLRSHSGVVVKSSAVVWKEKQAEEEEEERVTATHGEGELLRGEAGALNWSALRASRMCSLLIEQGGSLCIYQSYYNRFLKLKEKLSKWAPNCPTRCKRTHSDDAGVKCNVALVASVNGALLGGARQRTFVPDAAQMFPAAPESANAQS